MSVIPRRLGARAVPAALVLAFSAFSAVAPAVSVAQTPAPTTSTEPVSLEVWWLGTSPGQTASANQAMDAYKAAHPNVSINLSFYTYSDFSNAMPAALAAGNPPDFVFGDPTAPNAPNYVKAGQLVELSQIIKDRGWAEQPPAGCHRLLQPAVWRWHLRHPAGLGAPRHPLQQEHPEGGRW